MSTKRDERPLEIRQALAVQESEYLRDQLRTLRSDLHWKYKREITRLRRRHELDIEAVEREVKIVERELHAYKHAGRRTLNVLTAALEAASSRLRSRGDYIGADRARDIFEYSQRNLQPVADVPDLIDLLNEWSQAAPLADIVVVADLVSRTNALLEDLRL